MISDTGIYGEDIAKKIREQIVAMDLENHVPPELGLVDSSYRIPNLVNGGAPSYYTQPLNINYSGTTTTTSM